MFQKFWQRNTSKVFSSLQAKRCTIPRIEGVQQNGSYNPHLKIEDLTCIFNPDNKKTHVRLPSMKPFLTWTPSKKLLTWVWSKEKSSKMKVEVEKLVGRKPRCHRLAQFFFRLIRLLRIKTKFISERKKRESLKFRNTKGDKNNEKVFFLSLKFSKREIPIMPTWRNLQAHRLFRTVASQNGGVHGRCKMTTNVGNQRRASESRITRPLDLQM